MPRRATEPVLREIAPGIAAYLQPDGSWGLSNAGLIVGQRERLLVDTFFDLAHTRRLLDAFGKYVPGGHEPQITVNTHANGDHCYGNVLSKSGRLIASKRASLEMHEMPPKKLAGLLKAAKMIDRIGPLGPWMGRLLKTFGLRVGADFFDAAPYVLKAFSRFDFENIEFVLPNETFDSELEIDLGGSTVRMIELGPAHTGGDIVIYVPETKTLFCGDLLFEGMHPLIWAGTISSYLQALERLLTLDLDVVVPGHGELTDRAGVVRHIEYLRSLREAAEPLYHAGISAERAAEQLIQRDFAGLREQERLIVNVAAAYREFSGRDEADSVISMFGAMARLSRLPRRAETVRS
jgi:cyclase